MTSLLNQNVRKLPSYTAEELEVQTMKRTIFQTQFALNQKDPAKRVHTNQDIAAGKIMSSLQDLQKVITLVLGNTQSGKTGVMVSLLHQFLNNGDLNQTPVDNICILTALSSVEWIRQTRERFPECMNNQIFHLPSLKKKFVPYIKDKKDVLLLIDETQYGAKQEQTLHKVFKELKYTDLQTLLSKNIRIVLFTATPSGINYEITDWGIHAERVILDEGEGYVSADILLQNGKLRQYKNICGVDSMGNNTCTQEKLDENLLELQEAVLSFQEPRYHIIRIPKRTLMSATTQRNIQKTFGDSANYMNFLMNGKCKDINQILCNKPEKHTIIYIKERLRCAKTIIKTYMGVMVERYTTGVISDEVIVQGVRLTGYDYNGDAIMFTNVSSIIKYKQLGDSNFTNKSISWYSSTTKNPRDSKEPCARPTFINRPTESSNPIEEIEK